MTDVKRVKITLKPEALAEAKHMRSLREIATPPDFEGPVFENPHDVEVDNGFLYVTLEDALYAYPVASVARFALYK